MRIIISFHILAAIAYAVFQSGQIGGIAYFFLAWALCSSWVKQGQWERVSRRQMTEQDYLAQVYEEAAKSRRRSR